MGLRNGLITAMYSGLCMHLTRVLVVDDYEVWPAVVRDDTRHQFHHVLQDGVHLDGSGPLGLVGGDGRGECVSHDAADALTVKAHVIRDDQGVCILVADEGTSCAGESLWLASLGIWPEQEVFHLHLPNIITSSDYFHRRWSTRGRLCCRWRHKLRGR